MRGVLGAVRGGLRRTEAALEDLDLERHRVLRRLQELVLGARDQVRDGDRPRPQLGVRAQNLTVLLGQREAAGVVRRRGSELRRVGGEAQRIDLEAAGATRDHVGLLLGLRVPLGDLAVAGRRQPCGAIVDRPGGIVE